MNPLQERDFFRLAAEWLRIQQRRRWPSLRLPFHNPAGEEIGQLDQQTEMWLILREAGFLPPRADSRRLRSALSCPEPPGA